MFRYVSEFFRFLSGLINNQLDKYRLTEEEKAETRYLIAFHGEKEVTLWWLIKKFFCLP